jgi:hypothetical protein
MDGSGGGPASVAERMLTFLRPRVPRCPTRVIAGDLLDQPTIRARAADKMYAVVVHALGVARSLALEPFVLDREVIAARDPIVGVHEARRALLDLEAAGLLFSRGEKWSRP